MASPGRPTDEWSGAGDAELVAALKAGQLRAFDALFDRHQRSLINFFHRVSWDRHFAEECTQEVFLRIYSHLDSYEPQAKFTTFLYRVARNLWIDKLRAGAADPKPASLEASAGDDRALGGRLPSDGGTPVEILAKRETEDALKRAIAVLPEEQRLVVVLSELQGLKYEEIGEILGIPVGTVKSRMHAAVGRLKDLMTERKA